MGARQAFVSRSRDAGQSAADVRRAWVLFLTVAREKGRQAVAGRWPTPEDAVAFAGLMVRLKAPFPVPRLAAQEIAAASLKIGRALAEVALPEDRDALGELLVRAVEFLERQLHEAAHDAAALARRINGEAED